MKTIITLILILINGFTNAQPPLVTSDFESFETWSSAEAGELPDHWDGFNRVIEFNGMPVGDVVCIKKDSINPKDGNYAVEITSESVLGGPAVPGLFTIGELLIDFNTQTGDIVGGEAFTGTPTHFNGWFKYQPVGIDTGFVSLGFSENGVEILQIDFNIDTTTSTWTEFSIPLSFPAGATPDSVNVVFGSTTYTDIIPAGTKLSIDAIEFEYATASTPALSSTTEILLYPSPAHSFLTVYHPQEMLSEVRILDALGRQIYHSTENTNKMTIDVNDFSEGIYYVEVSSHSGKTTKTIKIN